MKKHSRIGADMIRGVKYLEPVAPIIRAHHERFDGTGYPDGLQGEAIPIEARIVAVLDSYDAMISRRPYKAPRSQEWTIAELQRCSGTQFDPLVIDAFIAILEEENRVKLELHM